MAIALTDDHRELGKVAEDFLVAQKARAAARDLLEAPAEERPPFWAGIAELGWLGLHIDEEHGGSGFGLPELVVVIEALGSAVAPGPFVPTVVTSAVLARHGSDDQKSRLLGGLTDGSTAAGVGFGGSVTVSGATATGDAGVVLGAGLADLLLIAAGDDVLLVDRTADGVTVEIPTNLDLARRSGRVRLDGAQVDVRRIGVARVDEAKLGEVTVVLDGRASTLGPGRLVLVPQRVVHEFIFRPGSGGYILTLTYALLHGLCARFGLAPSAATDPAVLALDADEAGRHTALSFHALDREYRGLHSPQRGPLLESLLSVILVWIHRQGYPAGTAATGSDPGSQHLTRYARMIETHHPRQHRVAWYAQRIGVTPAHLNAIVQALAGKSALELIHERLLLLQDRPEPAAQQKLRRQVSVLFLDVVNSTQLAQQLDPEEVLQLLDTLLRECTRLVKAFGGRVLQYAGDSLLAAFGTEGAREDDAERAVRCGLALLVVQVLLEWRQPMFTGREDVAIGQRPGVCDRTRIGIGELVARTADLVDTPAVRRVRGQSQGPARARGLRLQVEHALGNCAQYIHARGIGFASEPGTQPPGARLCGQALGAEAIAMIRAAETFFVASYVDPEGDAGRRQVDASHRGGKAGPVRDVRQELPQFRSTFHIVHRDRRKPSGGAIRDRVAWHQFVNVP